MTKIKRMNPFFSFKKSMIVSKGAVARKKKVIIKKPQLQEKSGNLIFGTKGEDDLSVAKENCTLMGFKMHKEKGFPPLSSIIKE